MPEHSSDMNDVTHGRMLAAAAEELQGSPELEVVVRGQDIEMRQKGSWFCLGLRSSAGSGAVLLRPWFGVLFHQSLWESRSWSSDTTIVGALNDHEPESHSRVLRESLQFMLSYNTDDLHREVLNYTTHGKWLEVQAYAQIILGDTEAPIDLLGRNLDRWENSRADDVSGQVPRSRRMLESLQRGGHEAGISVLQEWRSALTRSREWNSFKLAAEED